MDAGWTVLDYWGTYIIWLAGEYTVTVTCAEASSRMFDAYLGEYPGYFELLGLDLTDGTLLSWTSNAGMKHWEFSWKVKDL